MESREAGQRPNRHPAGRADSLGLVRVLAGQAFSRSAGAPLVGGNDVRPLFDASENYPAWEQAIAGARRFVAVEMYIFANDQVGGRFADLLAAKAREGVAVFVLCDAFGSGRSILGGLSRRLRRAGAQVRAFNAPRFARPLGWLHRDHRKSIVVDHEVAFVSGLCIADAWVGGGRREPWRDTGIEIRGPAVADAGRAFAETWGEAGSPFPGDLLAPRESIPDRGTVALRVIPSSPATAKLYRFDLLIASLARRTLWLTDAYFLATAAFMEAMRSAALDGVDVRLLVPRTSDVRWIAAVSRTLYRPLLESGVRIFEWDGSMIHAKTAVADGRWTRIGSTNLNLSSWLGNWELDVSIEDPGFARRMEDKYVEDLSRSTEVVLTDRRRVRLSAPRPPRPERRRRMEGSRSRAMQEATWVGSAMNAAVRGHRPLAAAEAGALLFAGPVALGIAWLGMWFPYLLTVPIAVLLGWIGVVLTAKGLKLRFGRRDPEDAQSDDDD